MPKRKVVQTVIVYRDGQRIRPAVGEIFDFKQDELDNIMGINPEALTRPIIEVDVENLQAQKEAQEKADAEAKAAAPAGKPGKAEKNAKPVQDEEV
jgi:hypothetical protein